MDQPEFLRIAEQVGLINDGAISVEKNQETAHGFQYAQGSYYPFACIRIHGRFKA
jgi:hypothetical protein